MVDRNEWKHLIDQAKSIAESIVYDSPDGFDLSVCHLLCNKDIKTDEVFSPPQMLSLVTKFYGDTEEEADNVKQNFIFLLQMAAICGKAEASIFITEAWMSPAPPDGKQPDIMPSQDPNHKEGIIVVGFHREHGPLSYLGFIEGEGADRHVASWDSDEDRKTKFISRFSEIIGEKEPNNSDILYAQVLMEDMAGSMKSLSRNAD